MLNLAIRIDLFTRYTSFRVLLQRSNLLLDCSNVFQILVLNHVDSSVFLPRICLTFDRCAIDDHTLNRSEIILESWILALPLEYMSSDVHIVQPVDVLGYLVFRRALDYFRQIFKIPIVLSECSPLL